MGRRSGLAFRPDYFPNVTLLTHEGRTVRFYDDVLRDKFVVLNFMYARCGKTRPLITANLVRVQQLLGERVGCDVFFYSITLRPEPDTPEALRRYAKAYGAGPGWSFLTGKRADIDLIRRRLGAVDPDPVVDAQATRHSGLVRYGNEAFGRWGTVPGEANPAWIVKAIVSAMPSERAMRHAPSARA
jgi:protein SCO1/2